MRHSDAEPSAEMGALIACARASFEEEAAPGSRAAVDDGGLDWSLVLSLAVRHRLVPLVWAQVERGALRHAPAAFRKELGALAFEGVARSLFLTAELGRVLRALEERQIPALAYKGPALAAQLYGDPSRRTFLDLDVLVRRSDFGRARESLAAVGYRPRHPLAPAQERAAECTECDEELVHRDHGAALELHWAVAPPYFSFPLSTDDLFARSTAIRIDDFVANAPSPEDLLLLLSMNGAKDLWLRLEPACLVARLLQTHAISWTRLCASARRVHGTRMLGMALCLASELLDQPWPAEAQSCVDGDRGLRGAVARARRRLLDPAPVLPGAVETAWCRIRSRERWIDRTRYCMMRALLPTTADCSALPLPGPLWAAAALVRPVRLLARAARRDAR